MYVTSMPHHGGAKDLKAIAFARLVREQTANCIKDLNALRAEAQRTPLRLSDPFFSPFRPSWPSRR